MRAYLSDATSRGWRISESAVRHGWPTDAHRALREATRILADVELGEVWIFHAHGSYPARPDVPIRESAAARAKTALAKSLATLTADGGPLDQLAAESRCAAIVGADWHGQAVVAGVVARNEARQ